MSPMKLPVKSWTERQVGAWEKCTECAYLVCMIHGGHTEFPLGAYTDDERNALDEASGYPNDIGSTYDAVDQGAMLRYGTALRDISGEGRAAFRARLNSPGRGIALAGYFRGLPRDHYLRRWQPAFVGYHAWTVVTLGGGAVLWLDPLAPKGHPGDKATVDNVMACVSFPTYAREALAGELIPQEETDVDLSQAKHQIPKVVRIRGDAVLYRRSTGSEVHFDDPADLGFDAELFGQLDNRWIGRRLLTPEEVTAREGLNGFFFFDDSAIDRDVPFRRLTYGASTAAEVAAVTQEWREWLATAPAAASS